MSIEDDIESGIELNKHDAFKKVSEKLAEKYEESLQCLINIEALEARIKELQDEYRKKTEEEMPELMAELGVSAIALPSGETVAVETNIHCGIPAHSKGQAHEWLRNHNHGDLIKNEIVVKFGRNEDNMVSEVKSVAENLGLKFDEKQSVHASTLKAFVKEQMKLGSPLPQDLFGVYIRRVVDVKLNKKLKG